MAANNIPDDIELTEDGDGNFHGRPEGSVSWDEIEVGTPMAVWEPDGNGGVEFIRTEVAEILDFGLGPMGFTLEHDIGDSTRSNLEGHNADIAFVTEEH